MSATARGFTSAELIAEQQRGVANLYGTQESDLHRLLAQPISFSDKERSIILQTCCGGASPDEAKQLIAIAEARGLNPIKGECFFVRRKQKNEVTDQWEERWSVQASIDSFRIKADETGLYDGQDEPEHEYDQANRLILSRVRVWRKGIARPFVGVARYDEYVQTRRDGAPTKFWKNMPHNQLDKCAEALAFRKGFPQRFSKVYTPEEMAQAETPHDPKTGEVYGTDVQGPSNLVDDNGTPATEPADKPPSKAFDMLSSMLTRCGSMAQLESTWKAVDNSYKSSSITVDERNQLASLKQMTAKRLKEMPEREPGSDDV